MYQENKPNSRCFKVVLCQIGNCYRGGARSRPTQDDAARPFTTIQWRRRGLISGFCVNPSHGSYQLSVSSPSMENLAVTSKRCHSGKSRAVETSPELAPPEHPGSSGDTGPRPGPETGDLRIPEPESYAGSRISSPIGALGRSAFMKTDNSGYAERGGRV